MLQNNCISFHYMSQFTLIGLHTKQRKNSSGITSYVVPRRNGTREVSHTAHFQYWGCLETPKQTNKNERQRFTKQTPPLNNYILRSWITINRISDKRHQWRLSYWHWDQNWPFAENADTTIDWKAPSIFLIHSLPKISKGTWLEGFSKSTKHI